MTLVMKLLPRMVANAYIESDLTVPAHTTKSPSQTWLPLGRFVETDKSGIRAQYKLVEAEAIFLLLE